jgi:hypothetical protein
MEENPKFWLVYSPSGMHAPRYRHGSKEQAEIEAKRLASQNGGDFFVLEAVGVARRIEATYAPF